MIWLLFINKMARMSYLTKQSSLMGGMIIENNWKMMISLLNCDNFDKCNNNFLKYPFAIQYWRQRQARLLITCNVHIFNKNSDSIKLLIMLRTLNNGVSYAIC